jgi:hypothetical protein
MQLIMLHCREVKRNIFIYISVNFVTSGMNTSSSYKHRYIHILATDWTVRGSNPGGGGDFSHTSRPALGPTQPPVQWVPGISRG